MSGLLVAGAASAAFAQTRTTGPAAVGLGGGDAPTAISPRAIEAPRWSLAVGSQFGRTTTALEVRGAYRLRPPSSRFNLQAEGAVQWTPSQRFLSDFGTLGAPQMRSVTASGAAAQVAFVGTWTPWPRAAVAPYLLAGVQGQYATVREQVESRALQRGSEWSLGAVTGVGLWWRTGPVPLRVELRSTRDGTSVNVGVSFPIRLF